MNCLYNLDNSYSFNRNTTAFVEMEDGINEYGLAVGFAFIYPKTRKASINSGMLVRYLLEKCKTTKEAIQNIKILPIASAQTLTIADRNGDIAVIECNPEKVEIIRPNQDGNFVTTANNFNSEVLKEYKHPESVDDWRAEERYLVAYNK